MSYQALYRKWRPRTFDEVKGQDAIVTTLKNQITSGRIGHAYLFCGTRGTGKTSVAKILARAVNCPDTKDGNPCNECDVCKGILNESSMNVFEIDAASNNGVDNIRDIKEQVQYPPTEGKYKVFIIDEVHMLSAGAFNALLKTLEEPPQYVIFILATTEVHKIPVTVLSRCQRYDFKRIPVEVISERLRELTEAEGIAMEDRAYTYIAKQADGAMRDALSLLDECVAFAPQGEMITYDKVLEVLGTADVTTFAKLFDAVAAADTMSALKVVDDAVTKGKELSQFATDFLWYMRNLLVIKSADDASGMIDASAEHLAEMKKSAEHVTKEALMRYIRIIAELINKMRYSSQKRVLLELALIKLITPQTESDYSSVLERIAAIEKKLENGTFAKIPVSAEGAYSQETTVNTKSQGPRTVKLEKAKYEDLMNMRKDWDDIVESLSGPNRTLLRSTVVEPGDGNVMFVVFSNKGKYDIGSRENTLKDLETVTADRYGKEFVFRTRLKDEDESEVTYVTEEELRQIINMDIDIEEE